MPLPPPQVHNQPYLINFRIQFLSLSEHTYHLSHPAFLTGTTASTSGHVRPYLSSCTSSFSHHLSILTIFHIQLDSLALPPPPQIAVLHIEHAHTFRPKFSHHLSHPSIHIIVTSSFPYHLSHPAFHTIFHVQPLSISFPSSIPQHLSHPAVPAIFHIQLLSTAFASNFPHYHAQASSLIAAL